MEKDGMSDDAPVVQLRHEFMIVSDKNDSVATATIEEMHGVLWLTNVWVHAEHRRKGYATRVLEAVCAEFGHADIWLNIHPYTNRPLSEDALGTFYARFGFERAGTPGAMVRRVEKKAES